MTTLYEEVRAALRESEFRPRKSRGQNFLIHERVIEAILRLLDLDGQDEVVEIGPGLGFLTRRLLARAARVWAVEIDAVLVERLRQSGIASDPKLCLIHEDILRVGLPELLSEGKIKLAGNLPYSISTPVLFRIFEWRRHFSTMVLMVQKEVADRIAAAPGGKDYGALSVWSQIHGRVVEKVGVAPEAFYPRPQVRSTILKIELWPEPLVAAKEMIVMQRLVRAVFGQRRKTLSNNLVSWLAQDRGVIDRLLAQHGIDPRRRGETLTVDEFIKLGRAIDASGMAASQSNFTHA